ncbi:MAG: Type III pantothenate kinase [Candidatus Omnitrophica bacterium ADurb.Bin277]|nr:MAG: Type III pantothenate kinase [Candidatus Omnitrophica bacterium ADurb.Bin277]
MRKCLVAIDVGNSSVKVGVYREGRFREFRTLGYSYFPKCINKIIKSGSTYHKDIVLCSVNPIITKKYKKILSGHKDTHLWICGENINVKINHKYNNYSKLGMDRKVMLYGATKIYKLPILVLSVGTALTCDYIDSKGTFQGGLIIPGPETAFKALISNTSLLPNLHFPYKKGGFLGIDTKNCMELGILEGYGALIDGIAERFRSRFGKDIRVLATGGLAKTIAPRCRNIDILDPLHTMKSLMILRRNHLPSPTSKTRA